MKLHTAVVGLQWGDEGKGKLVDSLTKRAGVVVRYQGGPNAGHTVVVRGKKHAFHLLPSGILHRDKTCLLGDTVLVDPMLVVRELNQLRESGVKPGKLWVSKRANLIMPWHVVRDSISGWRVGTTGRGIGPTYQDATGRRGIRVGDAVDKKRLVQRIEEELEWNRILIPALMDYEKVGKKARRELMRLIEIDAKDIASEYANALRQLQKMGVELVDSWRVLSQVQEAGKRILFEGAQAALLDIVHGDYPYVTSSHPTLGGVYVGTGFRPKRLRVIGVTKAYATRVGEGPFATELDNKEGEWLRDKGNEYGTTTGRPRRCGWADLIALRYAVRVNGVDGICMTKLDVLSGLKKIRAGVGYRVGGKTLMEYGEVRMMERAKTIYRDFEGWNEDITGVRKFGDLPKKAREYVEFVEDYVGVRVRYIGVGPGREEMVGRR